MVREARWDNDDVAVALHHDLDLGDALQLVAQLQRHAGGDFTAELCAMKRPKAVAQRPLLASTLSASLMTVHSHSGSSSCNVKQGGG